MKYSIMQPCFGFKPLAVCLSLLCFVPLAADTLYLKSGRSLQGKVVGQSRKQVRFQTPDGIRNIPKAQIRRIAFNSNYGKSKDEQRREHAVLERRRQEAARKAELEKERQAAEELAKQAEEKRKQQEAAKKAERERLAAEKREEAEARKATGTTKKASLSGALWRSALLPGWGQYYQGRTNAGWIYGGAFGGLLAVTLYSYNTALVAEADYQATANAFSILSPVLAGPNAATRLSAPLDGAFFLYYTGELQNARLALEQQKGQLQTLGLLTLGLYAWNLVDVLLYAPNQKSSLQFQSRRGEARLSFQYRF